MSETNRRYERSISPASSSTESSAGRASAVLHRGRLLGRGGVEHEAAADQEERALLAEAAEDVGVIRRENLARGIGDGPAGGEQLVGLGLVRL